MGAFRETSMDGYLPINAPSCSPMTLFNSVSKTCNNVNNYSMASQCTMDQPGPRTVSGQRLKVVKRFSSFGNTLSKVPKLIIKQIPDKAI